MKLYLLKHKDIEGGTASWFFVTIGNKHKGDEGLLAHEVRHVMHWYVVTITCFAAWWFSQYVLTDVLLWVLLGVLCPFVYQLVQKIPAVLLWVELDCYAVQLKHHKDDFDRQAKHFAQMIATKYGLRITPEKALQKLANRFNKAY